MRLLMLLIVLMLCAFVSLIGCEPFDVHPKIAPIFHDIMRKLKYNN